MRNCAICRKCNTDNIHAQNDNQKYYILAFKDQNFIFPNQFYFCCLSQILYRRTGSVAPGVFDVTCNFSNNQFPVSPASAREQKLSNFWYQQGNGGYSKSEKVKKMEIRHYEYSLKFHF